LYVFIATAFIETLQDYWMIKDGSGMYRLKWKFWGNALFWSFMGVLTAVDVVMTDLYGLLLFPIQGLIFWTTHDAAMGIRLKKGPFYLSNEGFDGWWKAVCIGSGAVAFWVRIFWLALFILAYWNL